MQRTYLLAAGVAVAVLAAVVLVGMYVEFQPDRGTGGLTYDPGLLDPPAPGGTAVDEELTSVARQPAPPFGPFRPPTASEAAELLEAFIAVPDGVVAARQARGADPISRLRAEIDYAAQVVDRARLWLGSNPGGSITWDQRFRWQGRLNVAGTAPVELVRTPTDLRSLAEVVRVGYTPDRSRAMVTIRVLWTDGSHRLTRHRMARQNGHWLEFDIADGRFWLWDNAQYADSEGEQAGTIRRGRPGPGPLARAMQLTDGPDADGLDRVLSATRGKPLPPVLNAWREYCEGRLRLLAGDSAGAAVAFGRAVAADPTWPMGYVGRAQARVRSGQTVEAFRDARTIATLLGP
ncbi:MAG: hypothetical protein U0871_09960 [Gemmataceae bacterium]